MWHNMVVLVRYMKSRFNASQEMYMVYCQEPDSGNWVIGDLMTTLFELMNIFAAANMSWLASLILTSVSSSTWQHHTLV